MSVTTTTTGGFMSYCQLNGKCAILDIQWMDEWSWNSLPRHYLFRLWWWWWYGPVFIQNLECALQVFGRSDFLTDNIHHFFGHISTAMRFQTLGESAPGKMTHQKRRSLTNLVKHDLGIFQKVKAVVHGRYFESPAPPVHVDWWILMQPSIVGGHSIQDCVQSNLAWFLTWILFPVLFVTRVIFEKSQDLSQVPPARFESCTVFTSRIDTVC